MQREVAVFINMAAAQKAGQAAVQETTDTYTIKRKYQRDALQGFVVQLKSTCLLPAFEHEPPRYIME